MIHFQHKVLLQLFNTSDDRAQKRQPIRGSDEGEDYSHLHSFLKPMRFAVNLFLSKKWSKTKQMYLPTVLKPGLKQTLLLLAKLSPSLI